MCWTTEHILITLSVFQKGCQLFANALKILINSF